MTELTVKQIKSFGFMVPPRGPKYLPPDVKKQIEKLLSSPSLAKEWKEKHKNIISGRQPKPILKKTGRTAPLTDVKSKSVREPLKRVRDFAAAYPSARSKKATPISTSPTADVPPPLRKPKDAKPRRKQSDELETSLAAARKKRDPYYFNKKLGKKMAAVTKEDLEKSGLNLTEYMNRITGLDSPGAFESKRTTKPKRKFTFDADKIAAGLPKRKAPTRVAPDTRRFLSEAEETELLDKWKEEKKQSRKPKPPARKAHGGMQSKKRTGHADFRKGGLFYK